MLLTLNGGKPTVAAMAIGSSKQNQSRAELQREKYLEKQFKNGKMGKKQLKQG